MSAEPVRLAILASGRGSNLEAILAAIDSGALEARAVVAVSDRPAAPALEIAARRGVTAVSLAPAADEDRESYDRRLAALLESHRVDWVILAGFMRILGPPVLRAFANRILNVHPSLLPAFPGLRPHRQALDAGVKVSGVTVHLVDAGVDSGPIVMQQPVPVLPGDSEETLAARILAEEHRIYPAAIALVTGATCDPPARPRRALVSVSDKTGLEELARALHRHGYEIVSTGGTARCLAGWGLPVTSVTAVTGFPEVLGGRVKTLHPGIFAGILARRSVEADRTDLRQHGIRPVDLVVVNLYPFEEASRRLDRDDPGLLEEIDIGGVSLIRAAAKNWPDVAVVVDPGDYPTLVETLEAHGGEIPGPVRHRLAARAFARTAAYDAAIGAVLQGPARFPETLDLSLGKLQDLRYGENPHQAAAFYAPPGPRGGFAGARQLQGKELSYNNLLDADAAWELIAPFADPAAVLVKHLNPSGLARGETVGLAFEKALACDPVSAFGGILAVNRCFDVDLAGRIVVHKLFLEVVLAPGYDPAAVDLLRKRTALRLIEMPAGEPDRQELRSVAGGVLVQDRDRLATGPIEHRTVTERPPSPDELEALDFAWRVVKGVKSNAIVVATSDRTLGVGAGQMSRVDSVVLACDRAGAGGNGAVLASDAFFPFPDGVDRAAAAGVTAVIQPGGSRNDDEVIAAANRHRLAMVFTGERHFRH